MKFHFFICESSSSFLISFTFLNQIMRSSSSETPIAPMIGAISLLIEQLSEKLIFFRKLLDRLKNSADSWGCRDFQRYIVRPLN